MIPLAHALVVLVPLSTPSAISRTSPITMVLAWRAPPIDNGTADFVFHVPEHTPLLGCHPHLGAHQALVPPGAFAGLAQCLGEGR